MADQFFVTTVLVTHDGATWLPEVIAAISSQSRPVEQIIAIDTGSIDNSAKLLKSSGIKTIIENRDIGYGDAVEHALAVTPTADENEWIWLIHDDCAPEKNSLALLLEAIANRPNVAIAGPKLLGWYERENLLEIGVSIAGNGARWTGLEDGEKNQGQHNGTFEVLAVSTAGALVKRSIFEELGGLDINLALFRDDIDLGWRAHVAGYSVICVADAIAYHVAAAANERRTVDVSEAFLHRPLLLDRRNAAYVLLVNSSWWMLPWVAFQLLTSSIGRALLNLLAKLPGYAADEIAAVGLLLIHPAELFHARRFRKKKRLLSPRVIARFIPPRISQIRLGIERISTLIVGSIRPPEIESKYASSFSDIGVIGESFDELDSTPANSHSITRTLILKPPFLGMFFVTIISIIASRSRFGNISGGALAVAPLSGIDLINKYAESWHLVGLGSGASTPPWVALTGVLSVLTLGNLPFFITSFFLLAPTIIYYAFYKNLERMGSSKIFALVGAGLYVASPVVWTSINQGRVGTLMALILAPALLYLQPFSRSLEISTWRRTFATSLLAGVIFAFNPIFLAMWVLIHSILIIQRLLEMRDHFQEMGWKRYLFAPESDGIKRRFALLITPWLLTFPWSASLFFHPTQFLLEPGIPTAAGNRWQVLLANPGGSGSPPLWMISPVIFFAFAAMALRELRTISLLATSILSVGIILSAVTITGHGSTSAVWTGQLIVVAEILLIPAVIIFGERLFPSLRTMKFGRYHLFTGLISVVTAISFIGMPFWAVTTGANSDVKAGQTQIVPAFISSLADTPARPKTIVMKVESSRTIYSISRGSDLELGDADVITVPPREVVMAMNDLVTGAGLTSAKTLGSYGIAYLYIANPVPVELARVIDGIGGFVRISSTTAGIAWRVSGASPRILFVDDLSKARIQVSATDVGGSGQVDRAGVVTLAEKFDSHWKLLLDGISIPLERSDIGLPTYHLPRGGKINLIHDGTAHRALISLQLLTLIIVVVLALPAGRKRKDILLEAILL